MPKIVAVANQKGGVGKTTTSVNLTAALHKKGRSVLLIDCDPQGNATSGMGIPKNTKPNLYDQLVGNEEIQNCIVETPYGDVIPSNKVLSAATVELVEVENAEFLLRDQIKTLQKEYDYIILDCPPSLELLSVIAFTAAESVLIPLQCEYYALEGIADLIGTIKLCNKNLNPKLHLEGILLTMYDSRTNLTQQVAWEVKKYFEDRIFETVIPRSIKLAEAPSFGKPGIIYDKWNRGSRAYMKLADEFIHRQSLPED